MTVVRKHMRNQGSNDSSGSAISRRQALQGIGVGVGALALGCGADEMPAGPSDAPQPAKSPAELLAGIDAIVVVMMENRSFDHYFGALRLDSAYAARDEVDGLRGDESNPDADGNPVQVFLTQNRQPQSPPHDWSGAHAQWNDGKNDGFVRVNVGKDQNEVMGYHNRAALPSLYPLADRFTICDRFFASIMANTWPNRFYLHSASSFGKKENAPIFDASVPTIWERLQAKNLEGKNYRAGALAFYSGGYLGKALAGKSPVVKLDEFFVNAADGLLPPFSMIDPDFSLNDDHPSHDINLGQAFLNTIVSAIAQSPQWARTLLCITYDENGGFYDHVSPPRIADDRVDFRQLGFRVPTVVVGGQVRAGAVNHTPLNHASIAATLRTRFGIDSLGLRMDASADLSSCIDPARIQNPAPPPTDLPKIPVNLRAALAHTAKVGSSQPELDALVATGAIPARELDLRPAEERLRVFLNHAQALGAVTIL